MKKTHGDEIIALNLLSHILLIDPEKDSRNMKLKTLKNQLADHNDSNDSDEWKILIICYKSDVPILMEVYGLEQLTHFNGLEFSVLKGRNIKTKDLRDDIGNFYGLLIDDDDDDDGEEVDCNECTRDGDCEKCEEKSYITKKIADRTLQNVKHALEKFTINCNALIKEKNEEIKELTEEVTAIKSDLVKHLNVTMSMINKLEKKHQLK